MISFISGLLDTVLEKSVIINNNSIGYEIILSENTISKLPPVGQNIKLYTHTSIKEDSINLYGFTSIEEIKIFNMIIGISGIGPKTALNILSYISHENLITAIITEDILTLSKLPGVGKKTSQRIILELKDKIKNNNKYINEDFLLKDKININTKKQDAIDALISLGYNKEDAKNSVLDSYDDNISLEDIIKISLKKLSN